MYVVMYLQLLLLSESLEPYASYRCVEFYSPYFFTAFEGKDPIGHVSYWLDACFL